MPTPQQILNWLREEPPPPAIHVPCGVRRLQLPGRTRA